MIQLFYRPQEFDDWGMIRNADGTMFGSVRRPLSEEEAAEHRTNHTDPFEELARALMRSVAADAAIARARILLDAVTYDSDGVMIGTIRQGGNGGLLSRDSLRAADEMRKALDTLKHMG